MEENKTYKITPTHYLYIGETDTDAVKREFRQLVIEVLNDYKKQHGKIQNSLEKDRNHIYEGLLTCMTDILNHK